MGSRKFLIEKGGNHKIDLFENGSYHTSVEELQISKLVWDSYLVNYNFYNSNEQPLDLEDEIFMDPKK